MVKVLYDGWALARAPLSPPALHLLEILAHLPGNAQPIIALPAAAPWWFTEAPVHLQPAADRLAWEQRTLPRLMNELGCDLLHLTDLTPPLINPPKLVISPAADGEGTRPAGFRTRLRGALARGGAARAAGWLLPEDAPPPPQASRLLRLPPVVHPAFLSPNSLPLEIPGKPGSYILFHAPAGEAALARALQAWTWAAGPIGEAYPLLMAGLDEPARRFAAGLAENYKLGETVIFLPPSAPPSLPALYQRAAVIFHPAESPAWGGAVRRALACGKPFVGLDTPVSAALAGPAAYLVPEGDARKLGAALLGAAVKESLQKQLSEAALARAAAWDGEAYRKKLGEVYAGI